MHTFRAWALLVTLVALLAGCPNAAGPNGPPATNAERSASLGAVQSIIDAAALDGNPDSIDALANTLAALPEFFRVTVYEGNIVAQFTDGETLVIFNNRIGDNPDGGETDAQKLASGITSPKRTVARSISRDPFTPLPNALDKLTRVPSQKNALMVNAMGTAYIDSTGLIASWFFGRGYDAFLVPGDVESLRDKIKDVGAFYMSTHGAAVPTDWLMQDTGDFDDSPNALRLDLPPSDLNDHFALFTATKVTPDTLEKYRAELRSGDLVYGMGTFNRVGGSVTVEHHFCITENFVKKYWRCGSGALIYMDACSSAAELIANACLSPDVGADAYIGWTRPVLDRYSTPTARFFFDRALGINQYEPVRSPPQRPFGVNAVLAAMKSLTRLDLPLDQSGITKNVIRVNIPPPANEPAISQLVVRYSDDTDDILLRPGIESLKAVDAQDKLIVTGHFGADPGTVSIGGAPLALKDIGWTSTRIECDLPDSATGPVVVNTGDRESNPRRLAQWNLTLHRVFMDYVTQAGLNCPSCFHEGDLNYTFRADTGSTRLYPEQAPIPLNYTGSPTSSDIIIDNAGGSYMSTFDVQYTVTLLPRPDDGAASIGTCVGFNPPADNNYVGACYFLDGTAMTIDFSPTYLALGTIRSYSGNMGTYDGLQEPYGVLHSGNTLTLTLSPTYTIEAGMQSTGPNSTFQWSAANATNPAQPDDPR